MPEAPHIDHVLYEKGSPIMDREQIDMLLMGDEGGTDRALARELFELFVQESSAKLSGLAEICAQGDVEALRNLVHFIAGSAGNLGLARLAAFYRGIERAIEGGALKDLRACQEPIRQEFDTACEAFRLDFNF